MGFFSRKLEEVVVSATDNDSLIWKVDVDASQLGRSIRLNVGTGCQALIFVNGVLIGAPREAGSHELELRKLNKNNDKLEIIGVRRDAQFVIKFGLSESNSVPYEDREAKMSAHVSVRGECYCKVRDGVKIYSAYGCRDSITAADVRNNVFGEITQRLIEALAKKLSEYNYFTISQSVNDLADEVKSMIEKRLLDEGFLLERCNVAQPYFGEDYGARREQAIKDAENAERKQDERDRELRIVEKAVAAATAKPDSKTCTCNKCGKQNAAGTKFCQFCGNKLI